MPALDSRTAAPLIKIMLIGHSGSGKTGSLTSLVKAGYKLRIIDMDQGLDALVNHVKAECPDKLSTIQYMSFRDKVKITPAGPVVAGTPKAVTGAVGALGKWEDGSVPSDWGPDTILVLDSLTMFGRAAFAWARAMNPASKESRQWYMGAQELTENIIANLTGEDFRAHVIVISHIDLVTLPDGSTQGFATSVGKALGPKLPRYFNTLVALETIGQGAAVKRVLKTVPTALLTLKNPAPMKIDAQYPIENGLATLFSKLSGKS